jgi:Fusaric acid resistance protein-like
LKRALVAIAAVLGAFATALLIRRAAHLSSSIEILAVALALSLARVGQRPEHRGLPARALALILLPVIAVAANELGTTIFRHPDLGDALFVLAVSATIWVRRFGELPRRIATLATLPLVAMLVVPAPVIAFHGGGNQRLWTAVIALLALAWVALAQGLAERVGFLPAAGARLTPSRAPSRRVPGRRRIAGTTKLALQMGVALAAAFAVGRALFGAHWTWVVLTAFIVCSGNRGREDVTHKAAMRLLGAAAGTVVATAVAGLFPAGDSWSIVLLFAVLSVALWLRPINYAFWAAGMTAALALLYGYYGEHGSGLLATRLEAIAIGAALAVAASWLLLPIRAGDIMRRDVGAALAALDAYLAGLLEDLSSAPRREERFRRAVLALEHHSQLLRGIPRRLRQRARIDHLPAIDALERCAELLPPVTAASSQADLASGWESRIAGLRAEIGELRQANARAALPDSERWNDFLGALRELPSASAA